MALHSQTASFLTFLGDIILSLDYKLIHCTPTFIDDAASKVLKIIVIVKKLTWFKSHYVKSNIDIKKAHESLCL